MRGRKPAFELAEAITFPDAVGNELTLRRALASLLEPLLARPERAGRPYRKLALSARLVGGGSWRRAVTLRDATTEAARLRAALGPKLQELPAPALELRLDGVDSAIANYVDGVDCSDPDAAMKAMVTPAVRTMRSARVNSSSSCF